MNTKSTSTKAIIDNWLLELVATLIEPEIKELHRDEILQKRQTAAEALKEKLLSGQKNYGHLLLLRRIFDTDGGVTGLSYEESAYETYLRKGNSLFDGLDSEARRWIDPAVTGIARKRDQSQKLGALYQLLDLLVLNDELVYDPDFALVWQFSDSIKPIYSFLKPAELPNKVKERLTTTSMYFAVFDSPMIVQQGAIYYFELARYLDLYYWPSPERATFLSGKFRVEIGAPFVREFSGYIDDELKELISKALSPLHNLQRNLTFPGFGSAILADCLSATSIFSTLMEYRNNKQCVSFRNWLNLMEQTLKKGDLLSFAQGLREVYDVVQSIDKELGLDDKNSLAKVELQIGLSPAIALDMASAKSVLKNIKRKPYHLTFLRNHLLHVLETSEIKSHAERLFPRTLKLSGKS